jgi:hypothetical protein
MTLESFQDSIAKQTQPPPGLSQEAQALWHAKKGEWEHSHNIAQDIHTPLGSWIHALLHLIEGDVGNANYWFAKAGRPPVKTSQIDPLWQEIAAYTLTRQ